MHLLLGVQLRLHPAGPAGGAAGPSGPDPSLLVQLPHHRGLLRRPPLPVRFGHLTRVFPQTAAEVDKQRAARLPHHLHRLLLPGGTGLHLGGEPDQSQARPDGGLHGHGPGPPEGVPDLSGLHHLHPDQRAHLLQPLRGAGVVHGRLLHLLHCLHGGGDSVCGRVHRLSALPLLPVPVSVWPPGLHHVRVGCHPLAHFHVSQQVPARRRSVQADRRGGAHRRQPAAVPG